MGEVVEVAVPSVIAITQDDMSVIEVETSAQTVVEVGYSQPGGGGSGPSGGAGYFAQQFQAANTFFTVNHNLNQFPAVVFVNNGGEPVQGDIDYVNANTVTITFTAAESGWVYCN